MAANLSPNTGRATQAARTCQKPPGRANRSCWREAASHWSRGSGGSRCPVTWHHTWGALTAHVAMLKSSCWLSYIPSMPTFIVKRGSGGRSQSCTASSSYKQKRRSKCRNWHHYWYIWFTLETFKFKLCLLYHFCWWRCLGVWRVSAKVYYLI